jgi:site-specific recombinase XerD
VQKLLGHSSLKTTQRYTKVIPVDVKKIHKETHPNETTRRTATVSEPA